MSDLYHNDCQWYVLRDLTRPNALYPAYKKLSALGYKVFTPTKSEIQIKNGKRILIERPVIHDLLFVFESKEKLDKVVMTYDTIQYRYLRGKPFQTPMTVSDTDMNNFIAAVNSNKPARYIAADKLTNNQLGKTVRLICEGPLNGYHGKLVSIKGSSKKRILIELPSILSIALEISPNDYIEVIDDSN